MAWHLQYIGRALKLRKGESGTTSFKIIPDGDVEKIQVSLVENQNGLEVNISPSEVQLDGSTIVTVNVTVKVPINTRYKIIWILKLEFKGETQTIYSYIGILPVNKNSHKVVLREAEGSEDGYWVGAPFIIKFKDNLYIGYRKRNPTERGHRLEIAKSPLDRLDFKVIKSWSKDEFGAESFEEAEMIPKPDGSGVLFLFTMDIGDFNIYKTEAPTPEELELSGATELISNAKDPVVLYDEDKSFYVLGYSNRLNTQHDPTIKTTTDWTSFTTKTSSLRYDKLQPSPNNNQWTIYNVHLGDVHKVDSYYVFFYDGGQVSGVSNQSLGICITKDLVNWIDLTPDEPIWKGYGRGGFRYVSAYCDDERYILIAEEEQEDWSDDLVIYYDLSSEFKQNPLKEMYDILLAFSYSFLGFILIMKWVKSRVKEGLEHWRT